MQGEIHEVVRGNGRIQKIYVYENSSDFPNHNIVILGNTVEYPTERVPINEEIWRKIGKALGYRFVLRGKK